MASTTLPVEGRVSDNDDGIISNDDDDITVSRKRMKAATEELLCPISHELLFDPVLAEDGELYERNEIQKLITREGDNLRSPMTNVPMGKTLLPVLRVRNTIQHFVESKAITGDLAKTYKQRQKEHKLVSDTKKKAEGGDIGAMESLVEWYREGTNGLLEDEALSGEWQIRAWKKEAEDGDAHAMVAIGEAYDDGTHGLAVSIEEAFKWYKKAADLRNITGMAYAGYHLLMGNGVKKNSTHGMALVAAAAEMGPGSRHACHTLAECYDEGTNGLPKDREQAKFWYKKASDDSCRFDDLRDCFVEIAKKRAEELEAEELEEPAT